VKPVGNAREPLEAQGWSPLEAEFWSRVLEHLKAGINTKNAYRFTLIELLGKYPNDPWLLRCVEIDWTTEHLPKFRAQQRREMKPWRDRLAIDMLAGLFRERGVRKYRGEAEQEWARQQSVTVHALRKRLQRRKK
jgi:hypothetical protein